MFKLLLKKELLGIFRGYFTNAKKNKNRSKAGTIFLFILFFLLMAGLMGGMFGIMAVSLCEGLAGAGVGWLYYTIMGLLAVLMGIFGSVFTTYSILYLAKDNEQLLSLPIPVRDIMGARMMCVYLMGLMYSSVVILPAAIVYWITASHSPAAVAGGLLLLLIISVVVLALSCLLGWVVAKLSLKLKNKSVVTVIIALAGFCLYYFIYFKAMDVLRDLVANAQFYGEQIKGAAYGLYLFGRSGEGDPKALAACAAAAVVLFVITWSVLHRSFLKIVTSTGAVKKSVYREKPVKQKSVSSALLRKEFGRFLSSSTYMLNCGLGIVLLPAMGIFLLVGGGMISEVLVDVFGDIGYVTVLFLAAFGFAATMNDTTAPSISLEGKNLWIVQSLPVSPWQVLMSKLRMHLLLSILPMLFCAVCAVFVLKLSPVNSLLFVLIAVMFSVMQGLLGLTLNVRMPNLTWINEMVAVKQGASVTITLFTGWIFSAAVAGIYLWKGEFLELTPYLGAVLAVVVLVSVVLYIWLKKKGAAEFAAL